MKRKGKQRLWLRIVIAAPLMTFAMALLCAWLMLKESVPEEKIGILVVVIAGSCAFLLSLYTVLKVPRKKLLWGGVTALAYGMFLLLGNLLFFGESYAGLDGVLGSVLCGGAVASLLGAMRHRKIA